MQNRTILAALAALVLVSITYSSAGVLASPGAPGGRAVPEDTWSVGPLDAITTTVTALQLAKAIAEKPSDVYSAAFMTNVGGTPYAIATSSAVGFPRHGDDYAILSTGNAGGALDADNSGSRSAINPGGDLVRGNSDWDVVILKIQLKHDVTRVQPCLSVEFRFLSEEFPKWLGTEYNDAFLAEQFASTWSTEDSIITALNNFAFRDGDDIVGVGLLDEQEMTEEAGNGTTYDGATPVYIARTPLTLVLLPNGDTVYEVYFSIFDQGDQVYDSAVFIDDLKLYAGGCVPGAEWVAD